MQSLLSVKEIYSAVKDTIVSHSFGGACMISSVIMFDILKQKGIEVDFVTGFLNRKKVNLCTYHVWIEYDGEIFDVAANATYEILKNELLNPKDSMLSKKIVTGYQRIDLDTPEEKANFKELFLGAEKFRKTNVFDWDKAPIKSKIIAYKCYEKLKADAPFPKPNPHHHYWVNDTFTRNKLEHILDTMEKHIMMMPVPNSIICHEILSTFDIKSEIVFCTKKSAYQQLTSDRSETTVCLLVDGVIIDMSDVFTNLRGTSTLTLLEEVEKDYRPDVKNYIECIDKKESDYWKKAGERELYKRKLLFLTCSKR